MRPLRPPLLSRGVAIIERMLECGPCGDTAPHRYTGAMWRCMRCEAKEKEATIEALADALEKAWCGYATYPDDVFAALRLAGRVK